MSLYDRIASHYQPVTRHTLRRAGLTLLALLPWLLGRLVGAAVNGLSWISAAFRAGYRG